MSSITPMMLVISLDERDISSMAPMALSTMAPERSALFLVEVTSFPASSARRLESLTVVVISSRAAAVCSNDAACCSVLCAS
ncbi:hypothetical protein D3C80_1732300 [compost metagenome]